MSYGSHEAVDAEASKAIQKAVDISSTLKNKAKTKDCDGCEETENQDWRYYYDLASKYAPVEGQEQSAEDKEYYNYYTYYYQYYYGIEHNKGIENNTEGGKDEEQIEEQKKPYEKYCKEYEQYCNEYNKHQEGVENPVRPAGIPDNIDYESRNYWEQYSKDKFVPREGMMEQSGEQVKDEKVIKRKKKQDSVVPEKKTVEEG